MSTRDVIADWMWKDHLDLTDCSTYFIAYNIICTYIVIVLSPSVVVVLWQLMIAVDDVRFDHDYTTLAEDRTRWRGHDRIYDDISLCCIFNFVIHGVILSHDIAGLEFSSRVFKRAWGKRTNENPKDRFTSTMDFNPQRTQRSGLISNRSINDLRFGCLAVTPP